MIILPSDTQIDDSLQQHLEFIEHLKSPIIQRLTSGILFKIPDYKFYHESKSKEALNKIQTYFIQKNKTPFFDFSFSSLKSYLSSEYTYFLESDTLLIGVGDSPAEAKKETYKINSRNCYYEDQNRELLVSAAMPKLKKWAYIKLVRKEISINQKIEMLTKERQNAIFYILNSYEQISQQNTRFKMKNRRQGNSPSFKFWVNSFKDQESIQKCLNLPLNKLLHLERIINKGGSKLDKQLQSFTKTHPDSSLLEFTLINYSFRERRNLRIRDKLMQSFSSDPNPEVLPVLAKKTDTED